MTESQEAPEVSSANEDRSRWFDDLVSTLRVHEVSLEQNVAPPERKEMYEDLMSGNISKLMGRMRDDSSKFFISKLVFDYTAELSHLPKTPLTLALDYTGAEVLVWAEIENDDEDMETALLKAEARTNAKYYEHGFHISSMIVESCDSIPKPDHYRSILKKKTV